MPIYEYECQDCGKQFEALQGIAEKPLKKCQYCNGKAKRLISQSSFTLKGGGWYRDGYVKKSSEAKDSTKPKSKEAPLTSEKSSGPNQAKTKTEKVAS